MRPTLIPLLLVLLAGAAWAQPADQPAAPMAGPMMGGMPGMMGPGMMHQFIVPLVSVLSPPAVVQTEDRIYVVKGDRLIAYGPNLSQIAEVTLPAIELPPMPGPAPLVPPAAGAQPAPQTPEAGAAAPIRPEMMHAFLSSLIQAASPAALSVRGDTVVVVRGRQVLTYNSRLVPQHQATLPGPVMPAGPAVARPMPAPAGPPPAPPAAGPMRRGPGLHSQPVQQIMDASTRITLTPDPPVVGDNVFTLAISNLEDQPVEATVTWSLTRTGQAQVIASGEARRVAAGQYRAEVRLPAAGPWQIAYRIRRSGVADQFAYYVFGAAPG